MIGFEEEVVVEEEEIQNQVKCSLGFDRLGVSWCLKDRQVFCSLGDGQQAHALEG